MKFYTLFFRFLSTNSRRIKDNQKKHFESYKLSSKYIW